MPFPSETLAEPGAAPPALTQSRRRQLDPASWPAAALALMMFVVPAAGVPSELMLQDTLKSALVAFGVLIAALVFFWKQRGRAEPLLWHGLVWLPLALMVYALGSMAWSHTYLAGVEAIRWFLLSLLLWLGLNTITRGNLPMIAWGIHGGALVASVWAASQFWFDFGLFPQGPMPASTFINRNFFAEYAVSALPFSVYVLANLRASRWLAPVALSLALNVVALMITGTRSALIALLVLAPVVAVILIRYCQQFAFTGWSRANKAMVGLVLVAGVLGLGSVPSANVKIIQEKTGSTALQRSYLRASSMTEGKEYTERSFSIRAVMWKATARMMIANPLTGVGAGAWEVQIPLYQRIGEGMETDYYAHNEFLQLLSEYGVVVGGLFIAVLLAYLLIAAGKTWRLQGPDLAEAPLRALALASLLALLIVSNAGFPWRLASTGALLALGLAILAGSDARLGVRESFFAAPLRWRPGFSRAMLGFFLCCALLAGLVTCLAAMAEHKIVHAINLTNIDRGIAKPSEVDLASRRAAVLKNLRDGIDINPHYRKIAALAADRLVAGGNWRDALWVLESIAASRPFIPTVWANIVLANLELGQLEQSQVAYQRLFSLQPNAPRTRALDIIVLRRTGQKTLAAQKLHGYFSKGVYDYDLVQMGYSLGLELQDWPLAIQALELHTQWWPKQAADSYMRLGKIYDQTEPKEFDKALDAFQKGLDAAPLAQRSNFLDQIPLKYQTLLILPSD